MDLADTKKKFFKKCLTKAKTCGIINTSNEREVVIMLTRLTYAECPKTRVEFIKKFNSDHVFRARAEAMGFKVLCGTSVLFPNGKIAGQNVK